MATFERIANFVEWREQEANGTFFCWRQVLGQRNPAEARELDHDLFAGGTDRDGLFADERPRVGVIAVSTSLFSRDEPGNASLCNGIKPDPRLDSFANLLHGFVGNG